MDWKLIWRELEDWVADCGSERNECSVCGHVKRHFPDWEEQQKKIEQLVKKHLRKAETRKV